MFLKLVKNPTISIVGVCQFKDFDNEVKRFFESRVDYLIGTIYYSYDDCPLTDDMKIILFNFYNFAGTPQTEEHKNKLQTLIKDKI